MRCARTRITEPCSRKSSGSTRRRRCVELERRILEHDPALLLTEPAGRPLRGYRLGERLGIGREGTVYAAATSGRRARARDPRVSRRRRRPARLRAQLRGGRAARRVARHDAIVPIHDYWREPGAAYLVMRRMIGRHAARSPAARAARRERRRRARHAHRRRARSRRGRRRAPRPAHSLVRAVRRPRSRVPVRLHRWVRPVPEPDRDGSRLRHAGRRLPDRGASRRRRTRRPSGAAARLLARDRPPIGDVVAALLAAVTGADGAAGPRGEPVQGTPCVRRARRRRLLRARAHRRRAARPAPSRRSSRPPRRRRRCIGERQVEHRARRSAPTRPRRRDRAVRRRGS